MKKMERIDGKLFHPVAQHQQLLVNGGHTLLPTTAFETGTPASDFGSDGGF